MVGLAVKKNDVIFSGSWVLAVHVGHVWQYARQDSLLKFAIQEVRIW